MKKKTFKYLALKLKRLNFIQSSLVQYSNPQMVRIIRSSLKMTIQTILYAIHMQIPVEILQIIPIQPYPSSVSYEVIYVQVHVCLLNFLTLSLHVLIIFHTWFTNNRNETCTEKKKKVNQTGDNAKLMLVNNIE